MPEPPASESPAHPDVEPEKATLEAPRQLHPAAVPIWLIYDAGRFFFALIPAILLGGIQPALLIVIPFIVASPLVRYRRFHYQLTDATLMVEGGLINRWQRVIPRERVQSVDVVEKLRHRAFGVVEVRVEAIGAQQTEAALVALPAEEADRIKRWAAGGIADSPGPDEDEPTHPVLVRLTPVDLVVAGATGGRVAVLAVLLGYGQEFLGEQTLERARSFVLDLMPNTSIVTALAILMSGLLIVSLVLSVIATVIVHWNFTLTLEDDRLVITRGLLDRRRAQIPLHRIQAVEIHENLLRKLFGLASLTVVVAGYNQQGQENERTNVLLPIGRRKTAWTVAAGVLGSASSPLDAITLTARPHRALVKNVILVALAVGVAGALTTIVVGITGTFVFLLLPLGWLAQYLGFRVAGHGIDADYVIVRSGVLVTTTSIVPRTNLQHLQLSWSALQESFALATVRLHIPRSVPRARDMDRREAARWFNCLGTPVEQA